MIEPNKVTEAIVEFMQNPTWKDIFINAPSGAMERLAISFYFSKFHDEFKPEDFDEYRALRDEYEKSLTEEDLNYLIENSDKDTAKKHYTELLEKLQGAGGRPQGTMRFEKESPSSNEEEKSGIEENQPNNQEETPPEETVSQEETSEVQK